MQHNPTLSQQVKVILNEKGFSFLFNDRDFRYFVNKTRGAFNKAKAIADEFLQDAEETTGDFATYIF